MKGSTKKNKKVLILEAGGPCGVACIKLLKKNTEAYVIGADMSLYAPGLQLAHLGLIVPPTDSANFNKEVAKIISKYEIDLIMPSFENGFKQLSQLKGPFITDFVSALLCKDKLAFMEYCANKKLPSPVTRLLKDITQNDHFPIFIKPRFGVGSRDNFIVKNYKELVKLKKLLNKNTEFIAQSFLEGNHWNVDVLVDQGKFVRAVPRKDLVQKSGNCISVEINNNANLIDFSKKVKEVLGLKSPFNLEVFEVNKDKFVINEINARFGGGIIFTALAGVDMVSYLIDRDKSRLGEIKEGTYSRYYEEIMVSTKNIVDYDI